MAKTRKTHKIMKIHHFHIHYEKNTQNYEKLHDGSAARAWTSDSIFRHSVYFLTQTGSNLTQMEIAEADSKYFFIFFEEKIQKKKIKNNAQNVKTRSVLGIFGGGFRETQKINTAWTQPSPTTRPRGLDVGGNLHLVRVVNETWENVSTPFPHCFPTSQPP